ncbi:MAG: translocation/assembly module TamB domain-containing protein [Myxococcota bacterium]
MGARDTKPLWLKSAITLMFLVVVAPICTLSVMIGTDWGKARIRHLVVQTVREELGLEARVADMEVAADGIPPRVVVSVSGIALMDSTHGPFVEADTLRIRPSLWGLVRGRVDLESIEIDRPVVRLVVRDGELRNLPELQGGNGDAVELPFRALAIRGARIELDADPHAHGTLQGVDVDLEVERDGRIAIRVDGGHGHVDHVKGRERVQRLLARGTVDLERGAQLDHAVLRTPYLRVEVREAEIPFSAADGLNAQVAVDLSLAHVPRLPIAWELPLEGHLHAEARVRHSAEGLAGEGTVQLDDAELDGWGFGDEATIEAEFDPDEVRFEPARFRLIEDGGFVTVSGTLGLGEGLPLDARVDIDGMEFDRLMDQLGVSERAIVSWHMNGGAHLRGTLDPLALDGPIQVQTRDFLVSQQGWDVRPRDKVVGVSRAAVHGRVQVTDRALSFLDLVGDTPRSRLHCDVRLGFEDGFLVEGHSDRLDLADVGDIAGFQIAGRGGVRVKVGGPYSDPALEGHLDLADFEFGGFPFGDVASEARMEKDGYAVRFPSVSARKRDSRYRVDDLLLDFSRDRFEAAARIHAQRLTLADLYHVFNYAGDERFEPYQGTVRGLVDVRYTLGFPDDSPSGTMLLDMDLDIPEIDIDGYAFQDGRLEAAWRWVDMDEGVDGGELAVHHLSLHKGEGTVSVRGAMGLGGVLHMSAAADRIHLHDTEGIGDALPQLGGSYGLVAEVRGTNDVPRVHLDMHLTGLTWEGEVLGDAETYVRLTDVDDPWVAEARGFDPQAPPEDVPCAHARAGLAHASWPPDPPLQTVDGPTPALDRPMAFLVCGEGLDGKLRYDLALGRTERIPLRGIIDVRDLPIAPFAPREAQDELDGHIGGRIAFHGGAMKDPASLVGRVALSPLHVVATGSDVALEARGPVDVAFDRGRFQVGRARFAGPGSELRITGGGSLDRGLALQLEGKMDLGLLSTLSPRVTEASGRVHLRTNLSGDFADPGVYGEAEVRDANFLFASFTQPVQDLNGRVTFSAHRVLFEGFRARAAGGRIAMDGSATLQDGWLQRYRFDVKASDLSIHPQDGVELGAGGDLRLAWARGRRLPSLQGTVRLDRVLYTRPVNLSPTLGELYRPQRVDVDRYDPAADQLALDVRIIDEGPIRIQNNLVDARIRIEDTERPFRVVGTDQRFGVIGTLDVSRGVVRFRNTEFDIRRGVIELDDPFRIDPHFDVTAVTEVRRVGDLTAPDWRITLHAHGNRDAFQLDARSEPSLSEEDVLMLLTVGMTRAEVEGLQAGELASGTALEALTAVTGVDREVQERVKLIDDFRITSAYSSRTSRAEPQVSVGKRIADRVRLSASTGLSTEAREFRTGVQWQLGQQTSVEASYDNLNTTTSSSFGNVGVDVRWRLEFE